MIDPFIDPMPAQAGFLGEEWEDGPGPWLIAGFDSPCSRGCQGIVEDETIRADGYGGYECKTCVDEDAAQYGHCSKCNRGFGPNDTQHPDGYGDAECSACLRASNS